MVMQNLPLDTNTRRTQSGTTGGFSLIEMIVATSIFTIAILVIVGALVSLQNASRKAQSIRVVSDNLSAAIDSITRSVRMGGYIHCGCPGASAYAVPQACPMTSNTGGGGDTCLAFEHQNGNPTIGTDQYVYRLNGNRIERSTDSGTTWLYLTAPELNISALRFYVGETQAGADQPYVTMIVRGTSGASSKTATNFDIQTTIGVRTPNFPTSP
jgi:prepilin-type N-terminal cleavage/methylation domain-containing protein